MKTYLGPLLGLCLVASFPAGAAAQQTPGAPADQAAEMAEARAIIAVMFPPATRQKMFDDLLTTFIAQFRQGVAAQLPSDPGLQAILDKHLAKLVEAQKPLIARHMPAVLEAMATAYSNEFTLTELKDVHAFAMTPSGQRYFSRTLAMVGDPTVAAVNTAMIADSQKVAAEMREGVKAEILAYLKAHPEAMPEDDAK